MDEFINYAVWFVMAIFAINFAVLFFMTSSDFTGTGFGLGTSNLATFNYADVNSTEYAYKTNPGNYITSSDATTTQKSGTVSNNALDSLSKQLFVLFFGWSIILNAIFASVPAGALFIGVLLPIIGMIEIVCLAALFAKAAAIVAGLL